MSSREKRNGGNTCSTCREYIDPNEFVKHVRTCNKRYNEENNDDESSMKQCGYCNKSTRNLVQHMKTCDKVGNSVRNGSPVLRNSSMGSSNSSSTISRNRRKKECPICAEMFDEDVYYDHVDDCGCDTVPSTSSSYSNQYHDENRDNSKDKEAKRGAKINEDHSITNTTYSPNRVVNRGHKSMKPSMPPKNTKQCNSCSQLIDERDYLDHVGQCGIDPPSQYDRANIQKYKQCQTCNEMIPKSEYLNHTDQCKRRSQPKPSKTKQCQTCDEMIPQDEYVDHIDQCERRSRLKPSKNKQCQTCNEMIPQDEYADHIARCERRSRSKPLKTKQCQTCNEMIPQDDYVDHIDQCQNRKPYKHSIVRQNSIDACPLCFKQFPIDELAEHAYRCNGPSSTSKSTSTVAKTPLKTCTTCSTSIDTVKNSSLIIPCQSKHSYCTKCLQQAMNQHLESNTPPVCNSQICDYELSKYNVCCLPLDNDLIQRLLPLVKSMQRAQCPTCLFYVEMKTMDDFEKHVSRCTGDGIPCQYCNCLINMNEYNDHENACRRSEPSDRLQAYHNYILSRTKYPMTIHELRVFLEERRKGRLPNDAHDIVNTLAEFGGVFPYDIPTRECDICMNPFVYDDIFVFGCEENHKACYGCFAESTETKMKGNEILTCVMCNYQLHDGEIKQLKIPAEQRRQYIDYQVNKTFSNFTGSQGILRCPNKGCKWMVELENPNERFKVICQMCQHEFCSLCSQQYHYQTTCQEMPDLTQRWFFWCNTERGNYWQARAQQDASYRTQLEDYQRERAANEQRNEELRQRYNELVADEQYKAQNCRLCPHCRRVVQHLSGCDLMVCGRNYHGGDDQSGCGQGFRWSQALPYQPVNAGPQQVTNNIAAPEQQKLVVHTGVQCDACHDEVQGIRFDCIHCSSLTFCEKCEQRATLQHSEQLRNQNKTQHVFKMITTARN